MLVKSENGVARAGLSEVMATFAQSPAAIIAKMNFVALSIFAFLLVETGVSST